jgi:hypothetical protein
MTANVCLGWLRSKSQDREAAERIAKPIKVEKPLLQQYHSLNPSLLFNKSTSI